VIIRIQTKSGYPTELQPNILYNIDVRVEITRRS